MAVFGVVVGPQAVGWGKEDTPQSVVLAVTGGRKVSAVGSEKGSVGLRERIEPTEPFTVKNWLSLGWELRRLCGDGRVT